MSEDTGRILEAIAGLHGDIVSLHGEINDVRAEIASSAAGLRAEISSSAAILRRRDFVIRR